MKTNLLFLLLLTCFAAEFSPLQAMSAKAAPAQFAGEKLAANPAATKHLKKENRWKNRLARLERKLQKVQDRLARKGKSLGGKMSLGIVGLFVLVLGGLFVLLGVAIPVVGILFIFIGGIVALVGILLMAILGGISVDTSDSSR